jgi:transcription elongation factor GreA
MEEFDLIQAASIPLLLTPEGYSSLQKELDELTGSKRADIANRLRDSQQHGEFSEDNSELDEVRFEQAMVESRIAELKAIFSEAQVLDESTIPSDYVGIGSWVTLSDAERNIEFEVRVVSSVEANPDEDFVSNESPLGTAIFGKSKGERAAFVAPSGKIEYTITKIRA